MIKYKYIPFIICICIIIFILSLIRCNNSQHLKPQAEPDSINSQLNAIINSFIGTAYEIKRSDNILVTNIMSGNNITHEKALNILLKMKSDAVRIILLWQLKLSYSPNHESNYFSGYYYIDSYTSYQGKEFDLCIKDAILRLGADADIGLSKGVKENNNVIRRFIMIAAVYLGKSAKKTINEIVYKPPAISEDEALDLFRDPNLILYEDSL